MNGQVGTLGVLHVPLVRVGIATEHELEAVPLQAEADRPIDDVVGRPRANRDAVLLVDDLVLALEVELVDDDLAAGSGQTAGAPSTSQVSAFSQCSIAYFVPVSGRAPLGPYTWSGPWRPANQPPTKYAEKSPK